MSIILALSKVPAERLQPQAAAGAFPWDDLEAARPIIEAACAESSGDPEREAELLILAYQASVPAAVRRVIERNPTKRVESCLAQVADYYSKLDQAAGNVDIREARWSVDTFAAMMGIIPVSEVGSGAPAQSAQATAERRFQAEDFGDAAPAVSAAPPPNSWDPTPPSASPAQNGYGGIGASQTPAGSNGGYAANTPLPPPPGSGVALGGALAGGYGGAPGGGGGVWPPVPGAGMGGRVSYDAPIPTIPPEVEQGKWSWAGFLGGIFWMCSHRLLYPALIWLGFFAIRFVAKPIGSTISSVGDLCLFIYLGVKGNQLAWSHRQFDSVEQFRTVQKIWVRVSLALILLAAVILALVLFPVFMHAYNAARHGAPASP